MNKTWTNEMKENLKTMCYAGEATAAMAEKLGVPVTEIYAKRSAMRITVAKCAGGRQENSKRTVTEIEAEIRRVAQARKEAAKKIGRCVDRLAELNAELEITRGGGK